MKNHIIGAGNIVWGEYGFTTKMVGVQRMLVPQEVHHEKGWGQRVYLGTH